MSRGRSTLGSVTTKRGGLMRADASAGLVEAARSYAGRGWPVISLHSVHEGRCTCGKADCDSPGKHPRTMHGLHDASADAAVIAEWWARWPAANIGIVMGGPARLAALDIDGAAGASALVELVTQHGDLPATLESKTGTGWHKLFTVPEGAHIRPSVGVLGKGLDIRAQGSYIVAPPSLHVSGRRYQWENDFPIAGLPGWLTRLLNTPRPQAPFDGDGAEKIRAGSRNGALTSIAGKLRRSGLTQLEMLAALHVINKGRCEPPLTDAEVSSIAASVAKYPAGADSFASSVEARNVDAKEPARIELIDSRDFLSRASSDERPYLIEGLIPAESHTMWQGRPKTGKSHSLLQLAFDASAGLPVFGKFGVRDSLRVGYVELEEPEPVTKKRLAAMIRAHGGKGPEAGRLRFFTREDLYRLRLLPHELLTTKLGAFADAIKTAGIEFLILIALRKFVMPGQSLKDPEVAEYINAGLGALKQQARIAVTVVHHDRKSPAATVEAQGFGSTMLGAEVDAVFDLRRRNDGRRDVCFEGRYRVEEEQFCLEISRKDEGEIIIHAPWFGEGEAHKAELRRRVAAGASINEAATALKIPKSTAYNWMRDD